MATQTVTNLQAACLSGVLLTHTKEECFNPWGAGHCRLSELSIEEFFSLVRRQSNNAQLSCRGYFQASARVSVKMGAELNKLKPLERAGHGGAPLSLEQFLVRNLVAVC